MSENSRKSTSSKEKTEKVPSKNTVKKTVKTVSAPKRNAKGQFVTGGAGGPGRPQGVGSRLLQMARESAEKIWPKVEKKALAGSQECMDLVLRYGMPRTKGYADDPDAISAKAQEILSQYKDGKLSLRDTALELEMNGIPLPDTIRILLSKEELEPEDPSAGVYCTVSDEEMEARVAARVAAQQTQIDGLPELRAKTAVLHKQVADSYAPGAAPTKPVEDTNGKADS